MSNTIDKVTIPNDLVSSVININDIEQWLNAWSIVDTKNLYNNEKVKLIPVFRVLEWFKMHELDYTKSENNSVNMDEYNRMKEVLENTKSEREELEEAYKEINRLKDLIIKLISKEYDM